MTNPASEKPNILSRYGMGGSLLFQIVDRSGKWNVGLYYTSKGKKKKQWRWRLTRAPHKHQPPRNLSTENALALLVLSKEQPEECLNACRKIYSTGSFNAPSWLKTRTETMRAEPSDDISNAPAWLIRVASVG